MGVFGESERDLRFYLRRVYETSVIVPLAGRNVTSPIFPLQPTSHFPDNLRSRADNYLKRSEPFLIACPYKKISGLWLLKRSIHLLRLITRTRPRSGHRIHGSLRSPKSHRDKFAGNTLYVEFLSSFRDTVVYRADNGLVNFPGLIYPYRNRTIPVLMQCVFLRSR